jgi:hypothetical protein
MAKLRRKRIKALSLIKIIIIYRKFVGKQRMETDSKIK